ncbi:MAG: nucleoside monophosphate kinase [Patescibacteria group bacterium]|jgi:adenylate kinase
MKTSNRLADIILYGGPASGKSTQAKLLVKSLKAAHMNMGGLLRAEIERGGKSAAEAKRYVAAGKLVPERISAALARDFIKKVPSKKRIVFDGYPRRMLQVRVIEPAIKKAGRHTIFIFIDLPAKVARDRIVKRAKIEKRIDDANSQVIAERIRVFHKNAQPVLKFYRSSGQLITINGDQSIAAIQRDIAQAVK